MLAIIFLLTGIDTHDLLKISFIFTGVYIQDLFQTVW
jgi:hypothetical protein